MQDNVRRGGCCAEKVTLHDVEGETYSTDPASVQQDSASVQQDSAEQAERHWQLARLNTHNIHKCLAGADLNAWIYNTLVISLGWERKILSLVAKKLFQLKNMKLACHTKSSFSCVCKEQV